MYQITLTDDYGTQTRVCLGCISVVSDLINAAQEMGYSTKLVRDVPIEVADNRPLEEKIRAGELVGQLLSKSLGDAE